MPAQIIIVALIMWGVAEVLGRIILGISITGKARDEFKSYFSETNPEGVLERRKDELSRASRKTSSTNRAAIVTRELAKKEGELNAAKGELKDSEEELASAMNPSEESAPE